MQTSLFARIVDTLNDPAPSPEEATRTLCAQLDDPHLPIELAVIAARNLEMLESGSSLGMHRGDLIENGIKGLASTHIAQGSRGVMLLSDFDPAVTGNAFAQMGNSEIIAFPGRHMILKVITGSLCLTRFDCDPVDDDRKITAGVTFTGERAMRLDRNAPACLFDAKGSTYRVTEVVGPVLCVIASFLCPGVTCSLRVETATGKVTQVTPNDHSFASAMVCLQTLPMLEPALAREAARKYLDHPVFYVRWEAIRQLAALEGTESLPLIRARIEEEKSDLLLDGLHRLHDHLAGV